MQRSVIIAISLAVLAGGCFIGSLFDEAHKGTWRIASIIVVIMAFFVLLNSRDKNQDNDNHLDEPDKDDLDDFEIN
jgi:hypothetical protein